MARSARHTARDVVILWRCVTLAELIEPFRVEISQAALDAERRQGDEIDRIAGAIKATHPEFRYQPITEPAESGNGGLVRWVSGRPGEAPAYAGTDFIIAQDGRIAAVYLFFDKLP